MHPRFHCPDFSPAPGRIVQLPEAAAHHAARVLRLRVGEAVTLFDGQGNEWCGELAEVGRKVTVKNLAEQVGIPEPALHITLVQALPAGDKMDWIVQKAVELGVSAIQPVQARRSVMRLTEERAVKRIAHWNEVAASACEQCGRNVVPPVLPVVDLLHYLGSTASAGELRFILRPNNGVQLRDTTVASRPLVLLIGPEGGFDPIEELAADKAGFTSLQLGPRVLRTETAGLAALAAMMALWGDI